MPELPLFSTDWSFAGPHLLLRRLSRQTEAETVSPARIYIPKTWCPRLISPPICRIYDSIDDRHRFMDCLTQEA